MATSPPSAAASSTVTPASWARALLAALGAPVTAQNVTNLTAWEKAEGTFNRGWRNPLDTTQRAPGSTRGNSVGVQSYPSWQAGIDATVRTLNNGRYGTIVHDLKAGNVDVATFAGDVRSSPWGSSTFRPTAASAGAGWNGGAPSRNAASDALDPTGLVGDAYGAIGDALDSIGAGAVGHAIGGAVSDAGHAVWGLTVRFGLVIAGFVLVVVALVIAAHQTELGSDAEDAGTRAALDG